MGKKRGVSMKRKVLLLAIIAILLLSGQAFADSKSKIGKKITAESPVYLDGVQVSDAVIFDGTSFGAIRELAEMLGLDVKFENGKEGSAIKLTSPEQEVPKEIVWEDLKKESDLKAKITGANNDIKQFNELIEYHNKQLSEVSASPSYVKDVENKIKEAQEEIITAQENIIKYKDELLALESAK